MREQLWAIDIRRSYAFVFEGAANNLDMPDCIDYTYSFQTDEGDRYMFIVQEFVDCNIVGLKFYRAVDYNTQFQYNILTNHKNPFRFLATIVNIIYSVVLQKFPQYSFVIKGDPTVNELQSSKNPERNSKKFRFYKRLLADFVSPEKYEVKQNIEKSILLYYNKSASEADAKNIDGFLASYGMGLDL